MTATEIANLLANRAEDTAAHLLPGGHRRGREWLAGSTAGEAGESLKVVLEGPRSGMWCDFAGADTDKGDLIGLWQKARNVTLSEACQQALDWLDVPPEKRNDRSHHVREPKPDKPRIPDQRWIELQSTMRTGTYRDLMQLSELRRISTAALELATRHGHLFFATVHDSGERHPAWILTDGSRRHAQARKMDGSLWTFGGSHKPSKSKTIWGTDSRWPVGLHEATAPEIALVEGAPDFLAAWHFIHARSLTDICRPVAMFGANTTFSSDALPLFSGKTIWMFPHNDDKGQGVNAARRWADALIKSGATEIRPFRLCDYGVKDLNELVIATQEMEACT